MLKYNEKKQEWIRTTLDGDKFPTKLAFATVTGVYAVADDIKRSELMKAVKRAERLVDDCHRQDDSEKTQKAEQALKDAKATLDSFEKVSSKLSFTDGDRIACMAYYGQMAGDIPQGFYTFYGISMDYVEKYLAVDDRSQWTKARTEDFREIKEALRESANKRLDKPIASLSGKYVNLYLDSLHKGYDIKRDKSSKGAYITNDLANTRKAYKAYCMAVVAIAGGYVEATRDSLKKSKKAMPDF